MSFLSPCIESTIQLPQECSSYTSSPTSPFSEPFPQFGKQNFSSIVDSLPMSITSTSIPQLIGSSYSNTYSAAAVNASNAQPFSLAPLTASDPSYSQHFPFVSSQANHFSSSAPQPNIFSTNPSHLLQSSAASAFDGNFSLTSSYSHHGTEVPSTSLPAPRIKHKTSVQEDETLRLLKKCYLEALLTQKPHKQLPKDDVSVMNDEGTTIE